MTTYRKKPVEVEAKQFKILADVKQMEKLAEWCGGKLIHTLPAQYVIDITTLEGTMSATHNDYIIKGIQGEFYPCKPDIFEASYEEVFE